MGITRQEALDCFHSDDLIGLGMEADAVRRHLHPEGVVSYAIDGRIDYIKAANGSGYQPVFTEIERIRLARAATISEGASPISEIGVPRPIRPLRRASRIASRANPARVDAISPNAPNWK